MKISKNRSWNLYSGPLFVICIIPWLSSTSAFIPVEQDNITHVVSGINIVNLKDPLFYDTFVPIIYEVDLPQWKHSDLKIEWPANFSSSCESSDTWGDNWTQMACPVIHHMNNVTEHFLKTMLDWKLFNSSQKTKPVPLNSCKNIVPHFISYSVGHEEWDEYFFEDLKNCPLGQQTIYEKLSVPQMEVSTALYTTMLSRFLEETVSTFKYRITGFSKYAVATNAFMALQGLELLDYVSTNSKWSNAISTCDNGKIPHTLISKETLGSSLKEIERALSSKDNYKLTVGADDYSTYYKLPLADCAFSTKNTLLVRILVPVKKTPFQHKLSVVQSIPFLRNDGDAPHICQYIKSTSTYKDNKVLFEENTGTLIPSKCKESALCLIPDIASRPVTDHCLSALVQNSTEQINSHCIMHCKRFEHLPYFRRLSSDKYVVLGQSELDIFVSCDTQPFKVLTPPKTLGALEITLPCSCQLVHHTEILHAMTPCGKQLILREIIPLLWSPNNLVNLTQMSNNNNKSSDPDFDEIPDSDNDNLIKSTGLTSSHNLQFMILSLIVVFLLCCNAFLLSIVVKIYKRVTKLEQLNSLRVGCSFYDTPMFVRANDD